MPGKYWRAEWSAPRIQMDVLWHQETDKQHWFWWQYFQDDWYSRNSLQDTHFSVYHKLTWSIASRGGLFDKRRVWAPNTESSSSDHEVWPELCFVRGDCSCGSHRYAVSICDELADLCQGDKGNEWRKSVRVSASGHCKGGEVLLYCQKSKCFVYWSGFRWKWLLVITDWNWCRGHPYLSIGLQLNDDVGGLGWCLCDSINTLLCFGEAFELLKKWNRACKAHIFRSGPEKEIQLQTYVLQNASLLLSQGIPTGSRSGDNEIAS